MPSYAHLCYTAFTLYLVQAYAWHMWAYWHTSTRCRILNANSKVDGGMEYYERAVGVLETTSQWNKHAGRTVELKKSNCAAVDMYGMKG